MLCLIVYVLYIDRCYALLMLLPCIVVVDGQPQRQMLSPLTHQGGRLQLLYFAADGKPQSCMLQHLKMADVIAKWQME